MLAHTAKRKTKDAHSSLTYHFLQTYRTDTVYTQTLSNTSSLVFSASHTAPLLRFNHIPHRNTVTATHNGEDSAGALLLSESVFTA